MPPPGYFRSACIVFGELFPHLYACVQSIEPSASLGTATADASWTAGVISVNLSLIPSTSKALEVLAHEAQHFYDILHHSLTPASYAAHPLYWEARATIRQFQALALFLGHPRSWAKSHAKRKMLWLTQMQS